MSKFRKKPVVVEAAQVRATDFNGHTWDGFPFSDNPQWLLDAVKGHTLRPVTPGCTDYAEWEIETLEGTMLATPGDWIIRGVKGEIYPCKPDIFAATYEAVDEKAETDR